MTPRAVDAHLDVYEEQQQQEAERRNADAWLAGQYVMEAIGVFLGKHHKYPKEPYSLDEKREPTMFELRDKIMARVKKLDPKEPEEIIGEHFEPL